MKVKLDAIIEVLELMSFESQSYLRLSDGEVYTISEEEWYAAEDDSSLDMYPEWQQESIKIAQEIVNDIDNNNFIPLPSKSDRNDYDTMKEFCYTFKDSDVSRALLNAIQGKGAFSRFKDTCFRLNIMDKWNSFHEESIRKLAIEWCKENNIQYQE